MSEHIKRLRKEAVPMMENLLKKGTIDSLLLVDFIHRMDAALRDTADMATLVPPAMANETRAQAVERFAEDFVSDLVNGDGVGFNELREEYFTGFAKNYASLLRQREQGNE